eukprot:7530080-Pyramimonas_sp.AAC.4
MTFWGLSGALNPLSRLRMLNMEFRFYDEGSRRVPFSCTLGTSPSSGMHGPCFLVSFAAIHRIYDQRRTWTSSA